MGMIPLAALTHSRSPKRVFPNHKPRIIPIATPPKSLPSMANRSLPSMAKPCQHDKLLQNGEREPVPEREIGDYC